MDIKGSLPVITETAIILLGGGIARLLLGFIQRKVAAGVDPDSPRTFITIFYRKLPAIGFILAWALITTLATQLPPWWDRAGFLRAASGILWWVLLFQMFALASRTLWPRKGFALFWVDLTAALVVAVAAVTSLGFQDQAIRLSTLPLLNLGKVSLSLVTILKLIIFLGVLLLATRRIMGFMRDRVLEKTDLDPNLSFALSRFMTFFLFGLGALIVISTAGIDLSALAIFGGALGIGLGFGFQNIATNLVSGFILLLDRSIKRGDVISVGENYGWVERLGARYIVVRTRDGLERLIPNANLITSEITNWSHSDMAVRLEVKVGVSYGSDPEQVKDILLNVAKVHPRVLEFPAPTVIFRDFGDSSLDFELRFWINDPQGGIQNIRSILRFAIWKAFKENGIEIPFPQRDLHIRTDPAKKSSSGSGKTAG
ncbi:MAG TPA: mechanosensitive ion channel domain-containing protein [Nitrospiria bacterium]